MAKEWPVENYFLEKLYRNQVKFYSFFFNYGTDYFKNTLQHTITVLNHPDLLDN